MYYTLFALSSHVPVDQILFLSLQYTPTYWCMKNVPGQILIERSLIPISSIREWWFYAWIHSCRMFISVLMLRGNLCLFLLQFPSKCLTYDDSKWCHQYSLHVRTYVNRFNFCLKVENVSGMADKSSGENFPHTIMQDRCWFWAIWLANHILSTNSDPIRIGPCRLDSNTWPLDRTRSNLNSKLNRFP